MAGPMDSVGRAARHGMLLVVECRHCRKVGNGFFIGCEYSEEIPWNVRAWFG